MTEREKKPPTPDEEIAALRQINGALARDNERMLAELRARDYRDASAKRQRRVLDPSAADAFGRPWDGR